MYLTKKAKLAIHNGSMLLWVWKGENESKTTAVEMRSLTRMCGVSLKERYAGVISLVSAYPEENKT